MGLGLSVWRSPTRQHTLTFALAALLAAALLAVLPPLAVALSLAIVGVVLSVLASPLAALIFLLLVAPLRTLIATEAPPIYPADTGQLALLFLIVVWGLHHIARRRLPKIYPTSLYVPLGVVIAAFALTSINAFSLQTWLTEWLKWVQVALLVIIVADIGRGRRWQWIIAGLAAAGAANALVGIYQFFGGSGALHLLVNGQNFRAFGTFGQPNPFGGFMGLLAAPVTMMSVGYGLRAWQSWPTSKSTSYISLWTAFAYGGAALLLTTGVLFSWSRGAWLAWAASIAVVALSFPRRLWQSVALLLLGSSFLLGLWATDLLPTTITARLASITSEAFNVTDVRGVEITTANYAVVERLAHWQAALRMANAHPWLGVGAGNYEVAYAQYRLINWEEPLGHAHNYYLNVLAETGMMGFVAYLGLWISIYLVTWRTRKHPDVIARSLAVGLLGTWTYLMVHSLTDNLYVNNLFLFIGVLLGLLAVLHQQQHRTVQVESP